MKQHQQNAFCICLHNKSSVPKQSSHPQHSPLHWAAMHVLRHPMLLIIINRLKTTSFDAEKTSYRLGVRAPGTPSRRPGPHWWKPTKGPRLIRGVVSETCTKRTRKVGGQPGSFVGVWMGVVCLCPTQKTNPAMLDRKGVFWVCLEPE